jgi:hypothetical protein
MRYKHDFQYLTDSSFTENTGWYLISNDFFINMFLPLWKEIRGEYSSDGGENSSEIPHYAPEGENAK